MGISEDGNADDENEHSGNETTEFSLTIHDSPCNVYVSVLDPVGELAFRPSKTKPLPRWMSLLPNNIHRQDRQLRKEKSSEPYPHTYESESSDVGSLSVSEWLSENNPESPPAPPPTETTPQVLSRVSSVAPSPAPIDIPRTSRTPREDRIINSVDREREYEFGDVDHGKSIYMTPPEYSPTPLREKTPWPPRRPSMPRRETTSYFSHGQSKYRKPNSGEDSYYSLDLPDTTEESAPSSNGGSANLPTDSSSPYWTIQSSEYLERYKPKSAEMKYEKYVAKEREPVIELIKRQRADRQSLGKVAEETAVKRSNGAKKIRLGNEEIELDPRRQDLKEELRHLFCKE